MRRCLQFHGEVDVPADTVVALSLDRHCERSEAISFCRIHGVLSPPLVPNADFATAVWVLLARLDIPDRSDYNSGRRVPRRQVAENLWPHLMSESKSTISQASSYKEIGDFWDTHDLADHWDQTEPVDFEVDIESEVTYYALDKELSQMLSEVAEERGISAETLLNLWVQEKLWKDASPETA